MALRFVSKTTRSSHLSSSESSTQCLSLFMSARFRSPQHRERREKEDCFEPTTKAAVGRPIEGQRGFLGFGTGRSQPLNPLLVLNKVDDTQTKKMLQAVKKLKSNPDNLQLSEDQQQHIINAFAATKWYARYWRPFSKVNYIVMRRWQWVSGGVLIVCLLGMMLTSVKLYRQELVLFQDLTPEEQQAYLVMVMGMRFSEIFWHTWKVLKDEDPMEALPISKRFQIGVRSMMKLGWHKIDWELESRERYPRSAWREFDVVHLLYWMVMYFGRSLTGSGTFFTAQVGDLEFVLKKKHEDSLRAERTEVIYTVAEKPAE